MASTETADDSGLIGALRHPTRLRLLRLMREGGKISPREISDELDEPLANVSYHVKVLAKCQAIRLVDTSQVRGATQHFYVFNITEDWALTALASTDPVDTKDPQEVTMAKVLADNVTAARKRNGWTQVELAERSGVSVHLIAVIEDATGWPGWTVPIRLALTMGLGPDELLIGMEWTPPARR